MKAAYLLAATLSLSLAPAFAADPPPAHPEPPASPHFKPEEKITDGSVTFGAKHIDYQATIGTLVVHPKGWDDATSQFDPEQKAKPDDKNEKSEAAMSYVAYIRKGGKPEGRPITFLYNGGPGSSTVWLHMGAFGPKRVVASDPAHPVSAPYPLVNNEESLLDVSDLVFIDAPGTGFGRVIGHDKDKAFFGVDADAYAFAEFITQYLSRNGRWNSPKYLFGESYGTTRSAALIDLLQDRRAVDFNGVIMLSQILNFDASPDSPGDNPGIELPYELALPTYAATAWYHHKLPEGTPKDLPALMTEVEHFAMNDYALALQAGATLEPATRQAIAEKLHGYTGLPVDYILKSDLRISGGQFEKTLQDDTGTTTGRLDTRFSGPSIDLLSKEADYDPQSAAIGSAYVSGFNDYARRELKYGEGKVFLPFAWFGNRWNYLHQPPDSSTPLYQAANVMPDLGHAMKVNPNLKIQLNAGYYDLATPFYEGIYEMAHLPIPAKLQSNIEVKLYESGHMVYAHDGSRKALHDNVAAFIRKTDNLPPE